MEASKLTPRAQCSTPVRAVDEKVRRYTRPPRVPGLCLNAPHASFTAEPESGKRYPGENPLDYVARLGSGPVVPTGLRGPGMPSVSWASPGCL